MPGDAGYSELMDLLLMLAGASIMPFVSASLHVPSAVLLILFGLLVGPHGAGLLHHGQVGGFLSEIGFLILMFLAGLEIDFNEIKRKGLRVMMLMGAICLSVFGLAFLSAWLLGYDPIVGLALGATSVGLPMAVLKESGRLQSNLGQNVLLVGSIGELITVIGMTLYYFLARYGFSVDLAIGMGKLFGLVLLAAVVLQVLVALAWWHPERFSKLVVQEDGSETGVRVALTLAMGFSIMAMAAGVEGIVGAFVAGAVMAFVLRGNHILENKLSAVGHGLFIPVFFIWVGLEFDPNLVTLPALAGAGVLLVLAFVIRLLPSLALLGQGLGLRQMFSMVSLLSTPLTLVVAIAAVGISVNKLDEQTNGILITMAVAAAVIFPGIFKVLDRHQRTDY